MFRQRPAFRCFNLFSMPPGLRPFGSLSFGTAKVGNFFFSARKKLKFLFFYFLLFPFSIFPFPPTFKLFPVPSEAECKGSKLFLIRKKKIKILKTFFPPSRLPSFQPHPLPFPLVPSSSEAECKGSKTSAPRNTNAAIFSPERHNPLEYSTKNLIPDPTKSQYVCLTRCFEMFLQLLLIVYIEFDYLKWTFQIDSSQYKLEIVVATLYL